MNPSIRKLKKLNLATPCPDKYNYVGFGFVFDSQNNDFKILRLCILSPDLNDESFHKIMVPHWVHKFYGCIDKGELLIKNDVKVVSIYPESLNQNILAIKDVDWLAHIANLVESLVLLDENRRSSEVQSSSSSLEVSEMQHGYSSEAETVYSAETAESRNYTSPREGKFQQVG
ncbi:hypothetical protein SO802_022804 [Lithocarpus litseifolius]|uniref:Uncharacterized protein n=1 Tax=Lithocarpus litseifolius TaxID=425828 RepID=A0AAW2C5Y3_9ROSI